MATIDEILSVNTSKAMDSVAQMFVQMINEDKRKKKVKQFKEGIDLVAEFEKAKRIYDNAQQKINNDKYPTVDPELPQAGSLQYSVGFLGNKGGEPPPETETTDETTPAKTEEEIRAEIQKKAEEDLSKGVDVQTGLPPTQAPPATVTAPETKKGVGIEEIIPNAPTPTEQELEERMAKIRKYIGVLATKGEKGQILANTLQKTLDDVRADQRDSYYLTTVGNKVVQASTTKGGKHFVIGSIPDDKLDYKPVHVTDSLPDASGAFYQDIIMMDKAGHTYTMRVNAGDPLLDDKYNAQFRSKSYSGNGSPKVAEENVYEQIVWNNTNDANNQALISQELRGKKERLTNDPNSYSGGTMKQDVKDQLKEIDTKLFESEEREKSFASQLSSMTGLNSKYLQSLYVNGKLDPKKILGYAPNIKSFFGSQLDTGQSIEAYIMQIGGAYNSGQLTYEQYVGAMEKIKTAIMNDSKLSGEEKSLLLEYTLTDVQGGIAWQFKTEKKGGTLGNVR